jgi:hypothetical protein
VESISPVRASNAREFNLLVRFRQPNRPVFSFVRADRALSRDACSQLLARLKTLLAGQRPPIEVKDLPGAPKAESTAAKPVPHSPPAISTADDPATATAPADSTSTLDPAPDPTPAPPPAEVFFEATQSYRNKHAYFGIVACLMTTAFIFFASRPLFESPNPGFLSRLAVFGILIMVVVTIRLILRCIRNPKKPIELNADGVRVEAAFYPWTQVKSLRQQLDYGGAYALKLRLHFAPYLLDLHPDGLTREGCHQMHERLKPFLDTHHSAVELIRAN